jgi:hypothetical protein
VLDLQEVVDCLVTRVNGSVPDILRGLDLIGGIVDITSSVEVKICRLGQ